VPVCTQPPWQSDKLHTILAQIGVLGGGRLPGGMDGVVILSRAGCRIIEVGVFSPSDIAGPHQATDITLCSFTASRACISSSYSHEPSYCFPLMKKVGVPWTPASSPVSKSR
jgi:hypothetical protein